MSELPKRPLFEVCVESAADAILAREVGAERVELCADLVEGGTTPSLGTIAVVRSRMDDGLFVMIRPRGGDFLYTELEFEIMERDIDAAKSAGVDGVVFGMLLPEGVIDAERTRRLVERAQPMSVTFHRAFDMTRDPIAALETLIDCGVDRLLTSGQQDDVNDGLELVAELIKRADNRLIVMPGAGIRPANILEVATQTRADELHFFASELLDSEMQFRNPDCGMGAPLARGEYDLCRASAAGIRSFFTPFVE